MWEPLGNIILFTKLVGNDGGVSLFAGQVGRKKKDTE